MVIHESKEHTVILTEVNVREIVFSFQFCHFTFNFRVSGKYNASFHILQLKSRKCTDFFQL